MATNDIGRVTPIWRGFYSAATTYELNDIVIDTAGSVWWHKSEELTTGVIPEAGEIWGAVIDMSVFSGLIQAAITTAQTALAAAQEAVAEVTADTERAETAARNAEASALSASESAASVGAYAQAAEQAKNAAQTAASQAAASASSAGTSAASAGSSAQAAETSKTAAQTAASQAAGSAETASGAAAVVEQKKAEAIAAIEAKGEEVLESIPEDYTELSNEVNDVKTQLIKRNIPTTNAVANFYANTQNGKILAGSAYSYVDFSVFPGDKLTYTTGHNESAAGINFYDRNGAFKGGYAATNGTQTITVPNDAYNAKASYRTAEENKFKVEFCEYIEPVIAKVNNAEYTANALENVLSTERYLTLSGWKHGSLNSTTGEETGSDTYALSDYVKILPNIIKYINAILTQGTYSASLAAYIYIYNSPSASGFTGTIVSLSIGTTDITDNISEGQYIRLIVRDGSTVMDLSGINSIISIQYDTVNTDETLKKPNYPADSKTVGDIIDKLAAPNYSYAMSKVLCIGDSLTQGSTPGEAWGATSDTIHMGQTYPSMLQRILNCSVINAGHSGTTPQGWYDNYRTKYNYADYDTYIIWLGTNAGMTVDSIETSGSQANYYCLIIDKILTDYAAGHTDPNFSHVPQIILLNCFAVRSGTGNVSDTNAAIDAIATKYQSYDITVINMSDLGYANHPELHENTDNPHFGKAGYIYVADRIATSMKNWFAESPTRADFAQTPKSFVYPSEMIYVTVNGSGSYTANMSIMDIMDYEKHGVNVKLRHSSNIYDMSYCNRTDHIIFTRIHYTKNPKLQFFDLSIQNDSDVITYYEKQVALLT